MRQRDLEKCTRKLSAIANCPLYNRLLTVKMKVYHYFAEVMTPLKPKNKIREFRIEKKLKQFALANRVGIHQSEISTIETGERMPSVYLAEKIAKALDKSVDEVFSDGL